MFDASIGFYTKDYLLSSMIDARGSLNKLISKLRQETYLIPLPQIYSNSLEQIRMHSNDIHMILLAFLRSSRRQLQMVYPLQGHRN
jgi:hypothetical protein